jgi:hypothetical protein
VSNRPEVFVLTGSSIGVLTHLLPMLPDSVRPETFFAFSSRYCGRLVRCTRFSMFPHRLRGCGAGAGQSAARCPRAIADALRRLGFETALVLDPDRAAQESAIRSLGDRVRGADIVMFFYAGHAVEANGRNALVPVTARIAQARDLPFETVDLVLRRPCCAVCRETFDALEVSTPPQHGTVRIDERHRVIYIPATDYAGTDLFVVRGTPFGRVSMLVNVTAPPK